MMKKSNVTLNALNVESFVMGAKVRGGKDFENVPTVVPYGYWTDCNGDKPAV